jgi:hypothetical protein
VAVRAFRTPRRAGLTPRPHTRRGGSARILLANSSANDMRKSLLLFEGRPLASVTGADVTPWPLWVVSTTTAVSPVSGSLQSPPRPRQMCGAKSSRIFCVSRASVCPAASRAQIGFLACGFPPFQRVQTRRSTDPQSVLRPPGSRSVPA